MALVSQQSVQREVHAAEVSREVTAFAVTLVPTDQPQQSVQWEVHAAEVYREVGTYVLTSPTDQPRHLAEIHVAPQWLWPALVRAMVGAPETETAKEIKPWTIEQTKATVREEHKRLCQGGWQAAAIRAAGSPRC
jgi:hypothetical protein